PTITEADIKEPVGAKRQMPTVVIREGLDDESFAARPTEIEPRDGIGEQRCRSTKTGDGRVARGVGEVHEKAAGQGVVRGEGEAEQAPFSPRCDSSRKVEEIGGKDDTVPHGANAAPLLDHELNRAIGGIL